MFESGTEFESFSRPLAYNSDHASFWMHGFPAVMIADATDNGSPLYPHYHSAADTIGNLSIEQVSDNVRLVVAFVGRFASVPEESLPDLVLEETGIEFDWKDRGFGAPHAGDSLWCVVRALNQGATMKQVVPYRLEIHESQPHGWSTVYEGDIALRVVSGQNAEIRAGWRTDPNRFGKIIYRISLVPVTAQAESDTTNNTIEVEFFIDPNSTQVENVHVFPNPASDVSKASLAYDLYFPSGQSIILKIAVEIYDITGKPMGYYEDTKRYHPDEWPGYEHVVTPLSEIVDDSGRLVPGLYICVVKVDPRGEERTVIATGRFGVVSR